MWAVFANENLLTVFTLSFIVGIVGSSIEGLKSKRPIALICLCCFFASCHYYKVVLENLSGSV